MNERFDIDLLDDEDPFEIDNQAAHLFKHASLGTADIYEAYMSEPVFYPAKPPADWLMVAQVGGQVLVVPLANANQSVVQKCRPIGCYPAAKHLENLYRRDREMNR